MALPVAPCSHPSHAAYPALRSRSLLSYRLQDLRQGRTVHSSSSTQQQQRRPATRACVTHTNNIVSFPGGTLFDLALHQDQPRTAALQKANSAGEQLVQWVLEHGGQANVEVARVPCAPRGLVAARDLQPGDTILELPAELCMRFAGSPEEGAVMLLGLMYGEEAPRLAPWLQTLPRMGSQIEWESLSDEQLDMLQCPELVSMIVARRQWLQSIWDTLQARGQQVSWEQLQWAATTVRARQSSSEQQLDGAPVHCLRPLLDLASHQAVSPNTLVSGGDCWRLVHCGQGLPKGAEVTFSYDSEAGAPLRNDMAALDYGFLVPQSDEASRLFCVDLPTFRPHPHMREFTPDISSAHDDQAPRFSGRREAEAELHRLQQRLAGFPTTEAHDRWLLSMPAAVTDRRDRFLIQVRMLRKRSLRLAMDYVLEALDDMGEEMMREFAMVRDWRAC